MMCRLANHAFPCREVLAQLQAVCAGHVSAAQMAVTAASEAFAQPDSATDQFDERAMAVAVWRAASLLPEAVQPALLAPLDMLLKHDRQVCGAWGAVIRQVWGVGGQSFGWSLG